MFNIQSSNLIIFFHHFVFDEYIESLDSSEETVGMLQEIYQKVFFMDHLIQQEGM